MFGVLTQSVYADRMKVAFINPSYPDEPFWSLMTNIMRSVATDLDVDLQVYYSNRNRFKSLELVHEILSSDKKPDYLVFHFQAQIGAKILQAAEQAKVYSLVINTQVPRADEAYIGRPRDKFSYWLGHIIPDDFNAGALLASALIEKLFKEGLPAKDKRIEMIGLTGTFDSTAAIERESGLKSIVEARDNIVLHQIVSADWDRQKASDVTKVLMARYPDTRVIWSASDVMALGAIDALETLGLKPGEDVLVGGVDGVDVGLEAVQNGKMAASISGHFVEAAWSLLLLFEHYQGKDLLQEKGPVLYSRMYLVDAANVATVRSRMNADYFDQLDFRSFSSISKGAIEQTPLALPDFVFSKLVEDSINE